MNQKQRAYFVKRVDQMVQNLPYSIQYPEFLTDIENKIRDAFIKDYNAGKVKRRIVTEEGTKRNINVYLHHFNDDDLLTGSIGAILDISKYQQMVKDFRGQQEVFKEKWDRAIRDIRDKAVKAKDLYIFGDDQEAMKLLAEITGMVDNLKKE